MNEKDCDHTVIRLCYGEERVMCIICYKELIYDLNTPDCGYRRIGPNLFRRIEQTDPQDAA